MSAIFRYPLLVMLAISVPAILITVGVQIFVAPVAGMLSNLLGLLYAIVVVAVLWRTPLWPREHGNGFRTHIGWVLAALLWGSGVAMVIALATGGAASELALSLRWEEAIMSLGGAWPEEAAKALGVLFILMSYRALFRPWHGFMVGMVVGLGFEAIENAMYGVMMGLFHPESDIIGMLQIWGLRTVAGPLLHMIWTGLVGWAIGLALYMARASMSWRIGVVVLYFLLAFGFHFAWNYSVESTVVAVVKAVVVYLTMLALWVHVWIQALRMKREDAGYSRTDGALRSLSDLRGAGALGTGAGLAEPRPVSPQS